MSRLTVGSLEGLSENSNVISVPTGHSLNVADAGGLQIGGSAVVSAGLVPITSATFSAVSAVAFPAGTFTTDYTKYRVIFMCQNSTANANLALQTNVSGSAFTGSSYYGWTYLVRLGTTVSTTAGSSLPFYLSSSSNFGLNNSISLDVIDPANSSTKTAWHGTFFGHNSNYQYETGPTGCGLSVAQSDDGFTMTPSTGTITGEYAVYAYV